MSLFSSVFTYIVHEFCSKKQLQVQYCKISSLVHYTVQYQLSHISSLPISPPSHGTHLINFTPKVSRGKRPDPELDLMAMDAVVWMVHHTQVRSLKLHLQRLLKV